MKQRVLTSLVLAPVVLGTLFFVNAWPFHVLGALIGGIASFEIATLLRRPHWIWGALGAVALLAVPTSFAFDPAPVFCVITIVGILAATQGAKRPSTMWVLPALLWCLGPLAALIALHGGQPSGHAWNFASPILLVLIPVWAGDIAAIFIGKAWGKHPLAPKISPKKTIEGSIGNLLAAGIAGSIVALALGRSPLAFGAIGVLLSAVGQAGDLFESSIKRSADLKDSGSILPGHGGIMDRIDSLLFAIPVFALVAAFVH